MGISSRLFLLSADDTLQRLANTAFWRMLHEPDAFRLPDFAGQRVRSAEAIVELDHGVPCRVLRLTFSVLSFDSAGRLDVATHLHQQAARVENWLAPVFGGSHRDSKVVEAVSRFVAQGGKWQPSEPLRQAIEAAALGRLKCQRVRSRSG